MCHGSEKKLRMYLATFDVATAKWIANSVDDEEVLGRITAASLRQMAGLESHAIFEHVDSSFLFTR